MMATMKAVWVEGTTIELSDHPIPEPKEGFVLIKVVAFAQNPKDWKVPEKVPGYPGAIQGSDVAGTVAKLGPGVTRFKIGDRVASTFRIGAFAEYASYPEITTFHIPDFMSFEEAATIPLGLTTSAMGIFRRLPLKVTTRLTERKTLLIWGAATSVGQFAVQMAKIVGLRVIGVAGNAAVAKEAGCDVVIDYRSGNPLAQIREALGEEKLQWAFDAVSEGGTMEAIVELFDPATPDPILVLVLWPTSKLPDFISYPDTSVFSVYGEEQLLGTRILPADLEDKAFGLEFFPVLEQWLREKKIRPNKVTIVPGGLAGIPEGFRLMRDKLISGEKLVYRVADTPGLKA